MYQPKAERRSARHTVRQVAYHVNEWGDPANPPLFLLHGWGDCGSSFQFLVDELRGDWFVIAPDWRGFGESKLRAEGYWFPDYLADLDVLLETYSPAAAVRIIGHSMGANVAGLYSGTRPERVAAFINVEGFGLKDSDADNAPDHYRSWLEACASAREFSTYDDFSELAGRIARRSPHLPMDRALYVAELWSSMNSAGRVEIKADPAHKLPNAVQYRRAEAVACWRRISAPVLLVVGAESNFAKGAENWNEVLNETLSSTGPATRTIAESGHMVHLEQPERLARVIEEFLLTL